MSSIHGVNVGGNSFNITDSSNIAPLNSGNFAVRDYAKDRFMIREDGLLYRATVAIASGDPLVINGNIKQSNIDEVISTIETDSDLIAPTEDGATSSDDYAIDEQIVRSGILYKVIDDITEGDAFVVGNNIELAGSVSEQITSLNEALTKEKITTQKNGAFNYLVNNNETFTDSVGVTYTVNSDKSISVSGTPTALSYVLFSAFLPKGRYTLTGATALTNMIWGRISLKNNGSLVYSFDVNSSSDYTFDTSTYTYDSVEISLKRNLDNVAVSGTAYPMIVLNQSEDIDSQEYKQYSMNNQILTRVLMNTLGDGYVETISELAGKTHEIGDFFLASNGYYYITTAKISKKTSIITDNGNCKKTPISNLKSTIITVQSDTLNGNTTSYIDISTYLSQFTKVQNVVMSSYTPADSWGTNLYFAEYNDSTKQIAVRTNGTTAQKYSIRLLVLYV